MLHDCRIATPTREQIAAEQRWAGRMVMAVLGAVLGFTALCALDLLAGPVAVVVVVLLAVGAFVVRRVWS